MEETKFKSSYDTALFTKAILGMLDAGKTTSFDDRFRSQKIQYFAQLFKVSPSYKYNLYIKGPYSPELTNDLFELRKSNIKTPKLEFVSEELEKRFLDLKKFLKNKDNRELELISTLHWLKRVGGLNNAQALKKLSEIKNANKQEQIKALGEVAKIWDLNK